MRRSVVARTSIIRPHSVERRGLFLACSVCLSVCVSVGHNHKKRRVPQRIPVLGSQSADDVSHKPGGRLPLLSARPAVTPAALKRAATNFAAW